eukprot:12194070-Alexandrium_andersonii.AAC.3
MVAAAMPRREEAPCAKRRRRSRRGGAGGGGSGARRPAPSAADRGRERRGGRQRRRRSRSPSSSSGSSSYYYSSDYYGDSSTSTSASGSSGSRRGARGRADRRGSRRSRHSESRPPPDSRRPRGRRRGGREAPLGRRSAKDESCRAPTARVGEGHRQETEHIDWRPGLRLGPGSRYEVEKLFGDGVTGRVLGCRDAETGDLVAVKVAKAHRRQSKQAQAEADVLRRLQSFDKTRCQSSYARLLDTFTHAEKHVCLVFEPLALSLRGLMQATDGKGMLLEDIRAVASRLLSFLAFMHEAGVVHTDLKCTNLMLRCGSFDSVPHPRCPGAWAPRLRRPVQVVVIDFGCATVPSEQGHMRVGARHVRAPEVVLGVCWSFSTDLWSLGGALHVLYTGDRLFPVHSDMEHLAVMEHVLEVRLPPKMLLGAAERVVRKGVAFDADGRLLWPSRAPSRRFVEKVERLPRLREQVLLRHANFLDLLRGLLRPDPSLRMTPSEALRSAFLQTTDLAE